MKKLKPAKKFTVTRKNWLRGNRDNSCLRNDKGRQCCLGFYLKACGYTNKDIHTLSSPSDTANRTGSCEFSPSLVKKYSGCSLYYDSNYTNKLMDVNDKSGLPLKTRENKLKKLFKQKGITVTFK